MSAIATWNLLFCILEPAGVYNPPAGGIESGAAQGALRGDIQIFKLSLKYDVDKLRRPQSTVTYGPPASAESLRIT